jgi:hypothetical protein
MKKRILLFLAIGACAQALSPLEDAVLESNEFSVKRLLKEQAFVSLSFEEKERILYSAYATSLDVIQEHKDSMQVWNSWQDIIEAIIGAWYLPDLVENISKKNWSSATWDALCCYVGIRGLQCKAQQERLTVPLDINAHLEKVLNTLKEKK